MGGHASPSLEERRAQMDILLQYVDEELQVGCKGIPDTVVEVVVKGRFGGRWVIVVENGFGCVQSLGSEASQEEHRHVDCKLESDMESLGQLADGSLKPAMAVLRGKIKYKGDYTVFKRFKVPFEKAGKKALAEIGPERLGSHLSRVTRAGSEDRDWTKQMEFVLDSSHPEWKSDENVLRCNMCMTRFTFFRRRHHCRLCGDIFCGNCASATLKGHRVCTVCFQNHARETREQRGEKKAAMTPTKGKDSEALEASKKMLPFEQLLMHIRKLQDIPIGASVNASEMSFLSSTRKLVLRLRKVESLLQQQLEGSPLRTAISLAFSMVPYMLTVSVLCLSWRTLYNALLDSASLSSSVRVLLSLATLMVGSNRKKEYMAVLLIYFFTRGMDVSSSTSFHVNTNVVSSDWNVFVNGKNWSSMFGVLIGRRPILTVLILCVSVLTTIASRFFGRLVYLYSTAGFIIMSYFTVNSVCQKVLRLSDSKTTQVLQTLDIFMAPFACNQILALRSVFVKFGQYIGSRADIIPPHWAKVLEKLQDDMPSDRREYVEQCIEQEFGAKMDDLFESFDFQPMASASVAQVHKAVVRPGIIPKGGKFLGKLNGADDLDDDDERFSEDHFYQNELEVAIKIQHEGIEDMMVADMVAFRRIVRFISWLNPRFEVANTLLRAWENEMIKELDFTVEASNLQTVRQNLRRAGFINDDDFDYNDSSCEHSSILVPKPVIGMVARRAFCMTFIHGFKITDLEQLNLFGVDRCALVKRVVQAYSVQLYVDGFFNADPHAGNLMVSISDDGSARPVLLDFGMVVSIKEEQRLGYCKLVHSISELSISGVGEAIAQVGYKNSQSDSHPERDLEFFSHLLRDTGNRKSQRADMARFRKRRKLQRKQDLEVDPEKEGRFFSQFPDSLIFLFRVLGLIRGLCTTLDAPISYLDIMGNYAKVGLVYDNLGRVLGMNHQPIRSKKSMLRLPPTLSPAELTLNGKVSRIIADFAGANVGMESTGLQQEEGFAIEEFTGAQVTCISKGKVLVNTSGGVLDPLGPVKVDEESLFPLMDLTRLLPTIVLLRQIETGKVKFEDKITDHWPKFYHKKATIKDLLTYSIELEDIVPPTTPISSLQDTKKWLEKLETYEPTFFVRVPGGPTSKYQIFTYGFVLLGLLEKILGVGSANMSEYITRELCENGAKDELLLSAQTLKDHSSMAIASNGFAKFVRGFILGGQQPPQMMSEPAPTTSNEEKFPASPSSSSFTSKQQAPVTSNGTDVHRLPTTTTSTVADQVVTPKKPSTPRKEAPKKMRDEVASAEADVMRMKLPSGVLLDPLIVNSDSFRSTLVPSFGGFGTASSLASVLEAQFFQKGGLSSRMVKEIIHGNFTHETSQLFGEWNWTYGFQRYILPDTTNTVVLVHHGFGGSLVAIVPSKQLVVTILVNCLTLDRAPTKEILNTIFKQLGVSSNVNSLFGGMF